MIFWQNLLTAPDEPRTWNGCEKNSAKIFASVLAERYYVTFALWHEPSVCRLSSVVCLSSVTLLHPTHRLELLGNI